MFIRCERCRTVYELETSAVSARMPTVGCQRCGHVFVAGPLRTLVVPGVIGGAASEARPSPTPLPPNAFSFQAPEAEPTTNVALDAETRQPEPVKTSRARLLVALSLIVVAGLAVAVLVVVIGQSSIPPQPPPSEAATTAMNDARTLLWSDDEVSLEKAIALFASAARMEPERNEPRAWLAFATTLLGETLACEVEDLGNEARWLESRRRLAEKLAPDDLSDRLEALDERQAAIKARLNVVKERSRRLLANGIASTLSAWEEAGTDTVTLVTLRAMALVFANEGASSELETLLEPLTDAERADSWLLYAAARVASDVPGGLRQAVDSRPGFERASWQLGRFFLASEPPDLEEASRRFTDVLASNHRHEGAARGLRRIEELRLPAQGSAEAKTAD